MARARLFEDGEYRAKLIAEARPIVEQWSAEGFFGKRAAPAYSLNETYNICTSREALSQPLLLCETHDRNGGEMIVGYARFRQTANRSKHKTLPYPAGAERVFAEKVSGIKTDRAALGRCLRGLEAGDVLLVTKLDRLARSTRVC